MLQATKPIRRRLKAPRSIAKTPDQQALWIKYDRIGNQLQQIARKADLLAWALQGVMALEDNDAVWPIQDAAYEIKDALETIAEEVRI
jgi:hypothetical protein